MNIYNALINSSLVYGPETWRLTENNKRRVEATEMDALKRSSRTVSHPPSRGPVPGPDINYTGPREA